jgi:squalene-associated FAD-dependent desaturase
MSSARVAIVGAGYAGMAAAVTLAEQGVATTVYEAGPVPGGRARRVSSRGEEYDNGQHLLVGAYRELLHLMRVVGVPDDAVLRVPLELRYAQNAFVLRVPRLPGALGLLAGLLLARGVSLGERLGAVRFMLAMRRRAFRVAPDCSVAELLARYRQDGAIGKFLWGALCVSALNTPPDEASANVLLAALRDTLAGAAGATDLVFPRVDLSRLFPEPAARYVAARGGELRLRSPVRRMVREGATLRVDGQDYAHVILACAPQQLAALIGGLPELADIARAAALYTYEPIYTCYLQYPHRARLPAPMLGFAQGPVQWVFDRETLNGESGQLACVISASGDHSRMSHDELARACHGQLRAALGELPEPIGAQVIAEKRATIACTPGIARIDPRTPVAGLFLAGDYLDPEYPPTLEAAVRSGVRAARLVLAETRR